MNHTDTHQINTNPFTRAFKGLDLLFKHNSTMAWVILVIGLVGGLFQFAGDFASTNRNYSTNTVAASGDPVNVGLMLAVIIPLILIGLAVALVVSVYFNGVINYVAWKTSRHETTTFSEAVKAVTKHFWTILVVQVYTALKIIGGLLLLIVPGVRAALRYQMVLFPVFDEGLNAKQAMERIKSLTKNHLIEVFGVLTVACIIPIIGPLLQMGGEAVLYPDLKSLSSAGASTVKVHWLNYIGFILLAGIALFAGLITFAVAVAVD